jgi:hypothetical protein
MWYVVRIVTVTYLVRGPGSSVGIVTDYGLVVPRIKSRWGADFSKTSRPSLLYSGYRVFPGGKAAGAWC